MEATLRSAAVRLQSELRDGRATPATFAAALAEIPAQVLDPWLDLLCDIDEIPLDTPELPRGCVPYLPCPAKTVLDALEQAAVTVDDTFVDVGSGVGRAAMLAHLKTGARSIGLEIQPALVAAAQWRAESLKLSRVRFIEGDAADVVRATTMGTVFFLYCPFSGDRLRRFLEGLEGIARSRPIRVCCVDMPPLELPWLARLTSTSRCIEVYRSTLSHQSSG